MEEIFHKPVMVQEVCSFLPLSEEEGIFVDATLGGGGHTLEILKRSSPAVRVIGIDQDPEAIEFARKRLAPFTERVTLVKGNFSQVDQILKSLGITDISGILFDLGVSLHQLKTPERGFSFQLNGPLDMRMNTSSPGETAYQLLNEAPEKELQHIISVFGEERFARRIARAIVRRRQKRPIQTTVELAELISKTYPPGRHRIHPATRTFMALRIFINREIENLEQALQKSVPFLKKGGTIVVIAYHSIEDRVVKNFFKSSTELAVLTKKPLLPGPEERRGNPCSRSARLRAAQKI
ncbi:MAG: rRNA (cytosine1402-N4)-methyltransferase [Candidatus Atribacteria bacterium]|jgi:16S rRNA (cytosine1402-N4)-methyltransferase|uniref:Ribosomal RNA small subunit methyltransferase H n=1 Tax=Thermatribacter velox TaxID=3039681 RepID=A0ABZ2Y811_9BACT|nr:rRNA (cytosine1402-N4)-methyltransferase [Candidatus Atribacteria bacterium]